MIFLILFARFEDRGDEYIVILINYVLASVETGNVENFMSAVKTGLSEKTGQKIITGAGQLIEKGKKSVFRAGMQQGIQESALKAEIDILTRQLIRHFGALSDESQHKITEADAETLLNWCEKILEAQKIDEVFNTLH